MAKQMPVANSRFGSLSIAIFAHHKDANGKRRTQFSVVVQRSYEEKNSGSSKWITEQLTLFPDQVSSTKALLGFAERKLLELTSSVSDVDAEEQVGEVADPTQF